jgi:hypothetical protein
VLACHAFKDKKKRVKFLQMHQTTFVRAKQVRRAVQWPTPLIRLNKDPPTNL